MEVTNRRYTAMFVLPIAPSKVWTTKIISFSVDLSVSIK